MIMVVGVFICVFAGIWLYVFFVLLFSSYCFVFVLFYFGCLNFSLSGVVVPSHLFL